MSFPNGFERGHGSSSNYPRNARALVQCFSGALCTCDQALNSFGPQIHSLFVLRKPAKERERDTLLAIAVSGHFTYVGSRLSEDQECSLLCLVPDFADVANHDWMQVQEVEKLTNKSTLRTSQRFHQRLRGSKWFYKNHFTSVFSKLFWKVGTRDEDF